MLGTAPPLPGQVSETLSVTVECPQSNVDSYWLVKPKPKCATLRIPTPQTPHWLIFELLRARTVGCQRLTDRQVSSFIHTVFVTTVKKPRIISEQTILKLVQCIMKLTLLIVKVEMGGEYCTAGVKGWVQNGRGILYCWGQGMSTKWEGNIVLLGSRDE